VATLAATYLKNRVEVKYSKDRFALQTMNIYSHILNIDEFPLDGDIHIYREMYNDSPIYIERKGKQPFKIDPVKLIINTNFALSESDPDKERRVEVQFTNYYNRTDNPVSKSLGGIKAFTDTRLKSKETFINDNAEPIDPELWWNQYIAFIIHCVQLYLKDINKVFTDMINIDQVLLNKHTNYINNIKTSKMYNDICNNIDDIIIDNKSSYIIRNTQLFDSRTHNTGNRTLAIIPHMLDVYLPLYTDYKRVETNTDRKGVYHKIIK
jgi:hypothetical protein